ncbi:MAG: hypothetical protein AAB919_02585 [Patescibacteria group bacterium]
MSANIPANGINAYMDSEKLKHLPPNSLWRLEQSVNRAWRRWLAVLVICFVGVAALDYTRGVMLVFERAATQPLLSASMYEAGILTFGIAFVFYVLVMMTARPPGEWRRYSLKGFTKRYGEWHIPAFEAIIHGIREGRPGAEFEIAALEMKFPNPRLKPVHFGLVLFQISDRVGEVFTTDGIPLRVCSSTGNHLTFDLQAAPAGAF